MDSAQWNNSDFHLARDTRVPWNCDSVRKSAQCAVITGLWAFLVIRYSPSTKHFQTDRVRSQKIVFRAHSTPNNLCNWYPVTTNPANARIAVQHEVCVWTGSPPPATGAATAPRGWLGACVHIPVAAAVTFERSTVRYTERLQSLVLLVIVSVLKRMSPVSQLPSRSTLSPINIASKQNVRLVSTCLATSCFIPVSKSFPRCCVLFTSCVYNQLYLSPCCYYVTAYTM